MVLFVAWVVEQLGHGSDFLKEVVGQIALPACIAESPKWAILALDVANGYARGAMPMTEAEWKTCTNPTAMLEFLRTKGESPDRKLPLLVRQCSTILREHTHSSGGQGLGHLLSSFYDCLDRLLDAELDLGLTVVAIPEPDWTIPENRWSSVIGRIEEVIAFSHPAGQGGQEMACQADGLRGAFSNFVRDIFHPFPSHPMSPQWLAWNDGCVRKIAQAVYEDRILPDGTLDNSLLAVLADALEEAGCIDTQILGHLRGPGPHIRGCFVVDAILGKEAGFGSPAPR
jgi:hypothetical protein